MLGSLFRSVAGKKIVADSATSSHPQVSIPVPEANTELETD